jgi:hypothetical protein
VRGLTQGGWARYNHATLQKGTDLFMSIDNLTGSFANRRRERTGK